MAKKKRRKLAPMGFSVDMKTGEISEVISITKATVKHLNHQLNEMYGIIKDVSGYTHSRKIDARIAKHLGKMT